MEPALDVINHALLGDVGARSFLERTTTIYVLDVNDTANPKTYGCWNFIHQGMNEVERFEARNPHRPVSSDSAAMSDTGMTADAGGGGTGGLVPHARMMVTMALRVARRSPSNDKVLVETCVWNASHYQGAERETTLRWLVDLNLELREIVIGRIAAMAFDFSFHYRTSPNGKSAFADRVVMDMLCAILSANAVASGPLAVQPFATEWIIPSSRNLPPFSVASVVLHLALEAQRKSAPAGTKDTLQQLSLPVMNIVLVPILSDAVAGNESSGDNGSRLSKEERSQVTSMCLRAMRTWCDATDLSLPQIKHLCSKVDVSARYSSILQCDAAVHQASCVSHCLLQINVVDVLSDAMYSDSHQVVDSLAELIETTVHISDEKVMSTGRMSQVRHIIHVDELSFQAQFTPLQLKTIESHEMVLIVDELLSAIGLQRFRFAERQNNGTHVSRCLPVCVYRFRGKLCSREYFLRGWRCMSQPCPHRRCSLQHLDGYYGAARTETATGARSCQFACQSCRSPLHSHMRHCIASTDSNNADNPVAAARIASHSTTTRNNSTSRTGRLDSTGCLGYLWRHVS
jgi:hypothetical protein